ncbi:hypothetical protein Hanom_Chr16g01423181 [Helianthus anomalus]
MEDGKMTWLDILVPPSYLVVALDVNGTKKYIVKWALDKFVPKGMLLFRLFFIQTKNTRIPTPSEFPNKGWLVFHMILSSMLDGKFSFFCSGFGSGFTSARGLVIAYRKEVCECIYVYRLRQSSP